MNGRPGCLICLPRRRRPAPYDVSYVRGSLGLPGRVTGERARPPIARQISPARPPGPSRHIHPYAGPEARWASDGLLIRSRPRLVKRARVHVRACCGTPMTTHVRVASSPLVGSPTHARARTPSWSVWTVDRIGTGPCTYIYTHWRIASSCVRT